VLEQIAEGAFSPTDLRRFTPLADRVLDDGEHFLVLADFDAYLEAQRKVDEAYRDRAAWWRKAIINTARVGKFSSDRSIRNYADYIWNVSPIG
jgi:starch phosphorylase